MYLSSWKEIAEYLHTSVRTAQRWERYSNLPVRRAGDRNIVAAIPEELERWKNNRRHSNQAPLPQHALDQVHRSKTLVTDVARNIDAIRRSAESLQASLSARIKARRPVDLANPSAEQAD